MRTIILLVILFLCLQTCYCQNKEELNTTEKENPLIDYSDFQKLKLQFQKLNEESKDMSLQLESLKKSSEQSDKIVDSLRKEIQQLNGNILAELSKIEERFIVPAESQREQKSY